MTGNQIRGYNSNGVELLAGGSLGAMRPDSVTNTGGSQAHLNLQPFLTPVSYTHLTLPTN